MADGVDINREKVIHTDANESVRNDDTNSNNNDSRKRRHSSSDHDDGDEQDDFMPEIAPKRFLITSVVKTYEWSLPDEMAEYANKLFTDYIPEKDVKDNILYLNPVPENCVKA